MEKSVEKTNIQLIENKMDEVKELLISKNLDYGDSVFKAPILCPNVDVLTAILVRTSDKVQRLSNIMKNNIEKPNYESSVDTVTDIVGYGILWLVEYDKQKKQKK